MSTSCASSTSDAELRARLEEGLEASAPISEIFRWAVDLCGSALGADAAEAHLVDQDLWGPTGSTFGPPMPSSPDGVGGSAMLIAPVRIGDSPPDAYIVLTRRSGCPAFTADDEATLNRAAKIIGDAIDSRLSTVIAD